MWQYLQDARGCIAVNFTKIFSRRDQRIRRESLKILLFSGKSLRAIRSGVKQKHFSFVPFYSPPGDDVRAKIWENQGTSSIRGERHEISISNEWKPTRGSDRPPLRDRGLRFNLEILSSFVGHGSPFRQIETILRSRNAECFSRSFMKHLSEIIQPLASVIW